MATRIITVSILVLFLSHPSTGVTTNNTEFSVLKIHNRGIFFEELNNVRLYEQKANVISSFEIPEFQEHLNQLSTYISSLSNICHKVLEVRPQHACREITSRLVDEINHVTSNELALHNRKMRTRRSPLNIGGKIAKTIFGTMDDDDAREIYSQLKNVHDSQSKTLALINQQTVVMQSNFETLATPINKLTESTQTIFERLNKLWSVIQSTRSQLTNDTHFLLTAEMYNEVTELIFVSLLGIERKQTRTAIVLNSINSGRLHPFVLTPHDLAEAIRSMDVDIGKEWWTPNLLQQIVAVKSVEFNKQVLVSMTIPVIKREEYFANKTYLLSFIRGNQSYLITPPKAEDVLITNRHKDEFILTTHLELGNCINIEENPLGRVSICQLKSPVYTLNTDKCVIKMYSNPFKGPTNCVRTQVTPRNILCRTSSYNTNKYNGFIPHTF